MDIVYAAYNSSLLYWNRLSLWVLFFVFCFLLHSKNRIDFLEIVIPFNLIETKFVSKMTFFGLEDVSSKAGIDVHTLPIKVMWSETNEQSLVTWFPFLIASVTRKSPRIG